MCIINDWFGCKVVKNWEDKYEKDLKDLNAEIIRLRTVARNLEVGNAELKAYGQVKEEELASIDSALTEKYAQYGITVGEFPKIQDRVSNLIARMAHQIQDLYNRINASTPTDAVVEIARLNNEVNHWQQQYSIQLKEVERLTQVLKDNGIA